MSTRWGRGQKIATLLARTGLPDGAVPVSVGLAISGAATYGFLILSARVLGADRYGSLSGLWALIFLVVPVCFFPLEQEVGREIAGRFALGCSFGRLLRSGIAVGAGLTALLVVLTLVSAPLTLDPIFDGDVVLLAGLLVAFLAYACSHLAKGMLSGRRRFTHYAALLAAENVARLVLGAFLAVAGFEAVGMYGLVVAAAPFVAIPFIFRTAAAMKDEGDEDPPCPTSGLARRVGYLAIGSLFAQLLLNAAPLAVKVLAGDDDRRLAGAFLASLVIARVPLFFFQAVQVTLLPRLAALIATGRHAEFRNALKRLLLVTAAVASAGVVVVLLVGTNIIHIFFGPDFVLGRRDLGALAAASGAYMGGMVLSQALIAMSHHRLASLAWGAGFGVFAVTLAAPFSILGRVEAAFLGGCLASVTAMGVLVARQLQRTAATTDDAGVGSPPVDEPLGARPDLAL
ncbi:MAG: lipopolysaccharide biosynthesis protein [Acidimicrobiales bacterium]